MALYLIIAAFHICDLLSHNFNFFLVITILYLTIVTISCNCDCIAHNMALFPIIATLFVTTNLLFCFSKYNFVFHSSDYFL